MKTVTLGVFCIYSLTRHFDANYACYLMHGILQTVDRKDTRHFPDITFYAHNFKDIAMLEALCRPYRQQLLNKNPYKKVPQFWFLVDPTYLNPTQLLASEKLPRQEEIEECLAKLLGITSRKQFGLAQTRMYLLLTEPEMRGCTMSNGYSVR
jgi:hypothetical protein